MIDLCKACIQRWEGDTLTIARLRLKENSLFALGDEKVVSWQSQLPPILHTRFDPLGALTRA